MPAQSYYGADGSMSYAPPGPQQYQPYGGSNPQMGAQQPLLQQGGGFFPGDRGKTDQLGPPPDISLEHLCQISIVAWVVFSVVCLLFGLSYHDSSVEIWTLLTLGFVTLTLIMGQSWRTWHESSASRVGFLVSSWMLLALVLGTCVGLFSYDCCIREYWQSQMLEARGNVLPSEPAGAYGNAGEIVFADEARIDPSKAVGYKDTNVYCVAPIASDVPMDTVQFWAVGLDCCGARGTFVCDDAWNPKARSGVVVRKHSEWASEDVRTHYKKAVKLAEVTYAIASAKDPIFVRWVSNPQQVELNIWRAGMGVVLAAIIISSLLCGLQACLMHVFTSGKMGRVSA